MSSDITNLAPWIVEVVRAQKDVDRGSVYFSLLKDKGEVVGLRTTRNRVLGFSKKDNREPMVAIADMIAGLGEVDCELKFTLDVREGRIRKLIFSSEEQKSVDVEKN